MENNEEQTKVVGNYETLLNGLFCPICLHLHSECVECTSCSNTFCSECIQEWLREGDGSECPLCREKRPNVEFVRNIPMQRLADAICYPCPFCEKEILWGDRLEHFTKCELYEGHHSLADLKNLLLLRENQLNSAIAWHTRVTSVTEVTFKRSKFVVTVHPLFEERLSAFFCLYIFGQTLTLRLTCFVPCKFQKHSTLFGRRSKRSNLLFSVKLWCGVVKFHDDNVIVSEGCLTRTSSPNVYKIRDYEVFEHTFCRR